jgi:F420-non-reducing hydrogenase iron-sulfur subunit
MAEPVSPDVIVNVCRNAEAKGGRLPRQWRQDGLHVLVREIPCSGKIDAQYLFHALESGLHGVCIVACLKGNCSLAQGNYRAEVRIRTVKRLLAEIGIEPERAELLHCSPDDPIDRLEGQVRQLVERFGALGPSPLRRGDATERSTA